MLKQVKGRGCWTRRLLKLATSVVFNQPPPSSPCSGYMRNASAVSVSLISASSCGLATETQLDAAAYALVTAAAKDGCSFASAVTSVSLSGASASTYALRRVCHSRRPCMRLSKADEASLLQSPPFMTTWPIHSKPWPPPPAKIHGPPRLMLLKPAVCLLHPDSHLPISAFFKLTVALVDYRPTALRNR